MRVHVMRALHRFLVLFLALPVSGVPADARIRVAVAASAVTTIERLAGEYRRLTGVEVEIVTGSSGMLTGQILQGAPFDLFFSADTVYPREIEQSYRTRSRMCVYAIGALVLACRARPDSSEPLKTLLRPEVRKVVIANPELAPYGKAAIDALARAGVLGDVLPKLVYAESVTHVNHFLSAGAAEAAITALSSVPGLAGLHVTDLDSPGLPQGAILLDRRPGDTDTRGDGFLSFVLSGEGRKIIAESGYSLP